MVNIVLTYGKSARIFSMDLAVRIGLNEAIVLNQIDYWLNVFEERKDADHFQDGRWWVYNTIKEWQDNFPCFSERTIYTILKNLRDLGVVETANYNQAGYDRTLWYTINYDKLNDLITSPSCKSCEMDDANLASPIPKNTKDIYIGSSPEKSLDDGVVDEYVNGDPQVNAYISVFEQEMGMRIMPYNKTLELIHKFINAGLTPEEYRHSIREQKASGYTITRMESTENYALNFKKPKIGKQKTVRTTRLRRDGDGRKLEEVYENGELVGIHYV